MKRFWLFFIPLLLTGCANPTFYAVSIADNTAGGLYKVTPQAAAQILSIPRSNYILQRGGKLYITQNAARKSSDRSGILNTVDVKTMKLEHQMAVNGITPCHLTVSPDGKFLYTANYSSGSLSEIPLRSGIPCPPVRTVNHTGKSIDLRRQKSPHPHFAGFTPEGNQLFVSDLGTDEIWIYNYIPGNGIELPCVEKLKLPSGSGPRHLAFAPDGKTIYIANELSSTAASFHKSSGKWLPVKNISTLPPEARGRKNFPGAIKITGDGRFFFITNRGADTIAVFKTGIKGDFELLANIPSGGQYPSDILLDEANHTLWTINLKNGTAVRFHLDLTAGILKPLEKISIPRGIALTK